MCVGGGGFALMHFYVWEHNIFIVGTETRGSLYKAVG